MGREEADHGAGQDVGGPRVWTWRADHDPLAARAKRRVFGSSRGNEGADEQWTPGVEGDELALLLGGRVAKAEVANGTHATGQDVAQVALDELGARDGCGCGAIARQNRPPPARTPHSALYEGALRGTCSPPEAGQRL